jgi:hypothetical protein
MLSKKWRNKMDMDELMNAAAESMKRHMNELVDYAINMYGSTVNTKNQVISIVVAQFVAQQFSMLGADDMLEDNRLTYGTDRIDMNVAIESLGWQGTRIGALAYVLAIKMETILPDDNSTTQDVAAVEALESNEYRLVGMAPPTPGFKLSNCYRRYIEQDQFVADMFLNND